MPDETPEGAAGASAVGSADPVTPQQFEEADGTEDWRAVARGACALFRTGSLGVGAVLTERIAVLAAGAEHHPDVDLRPDGLVVRLVSHDVGGLSRRDVVLAREISSAARDLGIDADPHGVQDVELTIDVTDRTRVMPFWASVLGYRHEGDADLIDPQSRWPGVFFQEMDAPRPLRNRLHLDVFVPHDERAARVDAALAAGGRVTTEEFVPHWWTLSDREGNEVDVSAWEGFDDDLNGDLLAPDDFRTADGVDDWRVLQGVSAHYPTGGFDQGVELVARAARLSEEAGLALFADLRVDAVTLRLGPPEDGWIDHDKLALARAIQEAGRELGLSADPSTMRDVQITFDALDTAALQRFWAAALGYVTRETTDLYDPLLRGPSVFFQPLDAPREQRNRIHVDVFVPADVADERVAAALAAGGRVVRDAELPFFRTIADPEGNEVDIAVAVGREEAWGTG